MFVFEWWVELILALVGVLAIAIFFIPNELLTQWIAKPSYEWMERGNRTEIPWRGRLTRFDKIPPPILDSPDKTSLDEA